MCRNVELPNSHLRHNKISYMVTYHFCMIIQILKIKFSVNRINFIFSFAANIDFCSVQSSVLFTLAFQWLGIGDSGTCWLNLILSLQLICCQMDVLLIIHASVQFKVSKSFHDAGGDLQWNHVLREANQVSKSWNVSQ